MTSLFVIEAPGKISTIEKILRSINFPASVVATKGRLYDLPSDSLGFDPKTLSEISYEALHTDVLRSLRKAIESHENIYIMTDSDAEGELIAHHIALLIPPEKKQFRLLCQSITKDAIQRALKEVTSVDELKARGALNRRVFDRLSGFLLSKWDGQDSYENGTVGRILTPLLKSLRETASYPVSVFRKEIQTNCGPVMLQIKKTIDCIHSDQSIMNILASTHDAMAVKKSESVHAVQVEAMSGHQALVYMADRTNESIKNVADSLQRMYEKGMISYARTESRALSSHAAKAVATIANRIGDKVNVEFINERNDHKIVTHDGLHVTQYNQAIEGAYDAMTLDDKLWTLIYRNNVSQLKDVIATKSQYQLESSSLELLKGHKGISIDAFRSVAVERGYRKEQYFDDVTGLCPELSRGWACTAKVDVFVAEQLLKLGLGRPSTIPYHSEKVASHYLDSQGQLNFRGISSLQRALATAPLMLSLERVHEVDRILLEGGDLKQTILLSLQEVGLTKDLMNSIFISLPTEKAASQISEYNLE
ncbi:DNA topoisomerase [Pseudomonas luteola]